MNTIHRTSISSRCPHGGGDYYTAEFNVGTRFVAVETIQKAIDALTLQPIYQEELTQLLANELKCGVITRGTHGKFSTECHAWPGEKPPRKRVRR